MVSGFVSVVLELSLPGARSLCYNRTAAAAVTISDFLATAPVAAPLPTPVNTGAVVVRGEGAERDVAARGILADVAAAFPHRPLVCAPPADTWPFDRALGLPSDLPPGVVVWAPDLHAAFENAQGNATRLVTAQALFLWPSWRERLDLVPDAIVVATADPAALAAHAPEALAGRGPWAAVSWVDAAPAADAPAPRDLPRSSLAEAFRAADPAARLIAAGRALDADRSPAHLLTMASVCMEVNDLDNAGALLDEATRADDTWAATWFERGKLFLRRDDMASAADAFGHAARLLPGFASAAANLGAVLGELDRPDEAMAAFAQALTVDPDNPQLHNNLGVLLRETGRLGDSEAAFRRVVAHMPDMAFGHYNLGHTLFLQGRYQAALAAYQAGQRLDAARSPVQASRLAMARLATGDATGALRDLQGCVANLPRDYRRQLLADTQSVAWALLSAMPELRDWRVVGDWLAAELAKG